MTAAVAPAATHDAPSRFSETSTAAEVLADLDLSGRTAIVTGASSGVGAATARALAGAGAEVVLAVRDLAAGQVVAEEIAAAGQGRARVERLDLLSLASVRDFVGRWGERPLHMLINNAGLMGPPFELTEDGFESQMAVNFFGPFALTRGLIPNLLAAAPARVVVVSSGSHHMSDVHLDDLNSERRPYEKFVAYGHAKTAANLLAVAVHRRYGARGVTANAVTPGAVFTNLGRHVTQQDAIDLGWLRPDGTVPDMIFKTPEQGAATSVWAAAAPELEGVGGRYLEDCQVAPLWDAAVPLKGVKAYSLDPDKADRLWEIAEQLVDQPARTA